MRVVVTGAAGFLGSHITDRLLSEGHTVLGVDNLSTGTLDNLAHLSDEPRFRFEERDICKPFDPGRGRDHSRPRSWTTVPRPARPRLTVRRHSPAAGSPAAQHPG